MIKDEHFVILIHKNVDGDCCGSSVALALLLEQQGAKATIVSSEDFPKRYSWLAKKPQKEYPVDFTRIITVDSSNADNINMPIKEGYPVLVIDHHEANKKDFGNYFIIDADKASTSMIIEEMRVAADVPLTKDFAEAVLLGIVSDTGLFIYDTATKEVFDMVTSLLEVEGVDYQKVILTDLAFFDSKNIPIFSDIINTIENIDGVVFCNLLPFYARDNFDTAQIRYMLRAFFYRLSDMLFTFTYYKQTPDDDRVAVSVTSSSFSLFDVFKSHFSFDIFGHDKVIVFYIQEDDIEKYKKEVIDLLLSL